MERLNARVKTSGGRSGAFFYFTADHEFVLKTITSEELHIFKSIIKDYKNHITDKQGSLLSKVFGVFKLKIDKSSTFRIVLMENLASRLIDPIIFDMKGSKSDRHASFSVYADINRMRRDKVYKDIDFSDNIGHISVTQEELNNLLSKLKRDAHLLEKHMIMDYSLLLMIENINCLRNTMINKTFVASYGKFIVFAGVIDFLQTYNTKKKLEHRYKKLKNQESIHFSSIAPTPYRKRFIRMVKNVFKREEIN
jgi:1-phosphatidylinositol-4-phosphate 5-kinase